MADVQDIEAAVRKRDRTARLPVGRNQRDQLVVGRDFRGQRSMARSSSSALIVDVPRFMTTTPPAKFARCAASLNVAPPASARANVAMTVSPAPVTSVT